MGSKLKYRQSIFAAAMCSVSLFSTLAFGEEYHFALVDPTTAGSGSPEGQALSNALQKLQWAQSVLSGVEGSTVDQDKIADMIKSIKAIQTVERKIQKQVEKEKSIATEKDAENQAALVGEILSISQNVDWYVENGRDPQGVKAEIKKVVGLDFVVKMAGFILGQDINDKVHSDGDGSATTITVESSAIRESISRQEKALINALGTRNIAEVNTEGGSEIKTVQSIYAESKSREASDALITYAKNKFKDSEARALAITVLAVWFEEDIFYLATKLFSDATEKTEMRLRTLSELVSFAKTRGESVANKTRRYLTDFTTANETSEEVFTNVVYYLGSAEELGSDEMTRFLRAKKSWYDDNELYQRDSIIGEALSSKLSPINPSSVKN